jgi:hypothetical protein
MLPLVLSLCVGNQFRWIMPTTPYSKVPDLPIYLGKGEESLPWDALGLPPYSITESVKDNLGVRALEFTDRCLKPINASLIVATSNTSTYFGAYHWGDGQDQLPDRNDIKWLSYVDSSGITITYIAKRIGNLYHWKLFKERDLYHEAYILHLKIIDSSLINISDIDVGLLHTMLCTAVTQQKNLYIHCKDGIGHSATVTLASLMLMQHSFHYKLPMKPEGDNQQYIAGLVAWAHQNVRTGLFGNPLSFGQISAPNQERIRAPLPLANRLISLHQSQSPIKLSRLVFLNNEEVNTILNLENSVESTLSGYCTDKLERDIELVMNIALIKNDYIKILAVAKNIASLNMVNYITSVLEKIFLKLYGLDRLHPQYLELIDEFFLFFLSLPEHYKTLDMLNAINYLKDIPLVKLGATNCLAALKDQCFTKQGTIKKNYYLLLRCLIQSCHDPSAAYFANDLKKIERFFIASAVETTTYYFFWNNEKSIAIWCLNLLAQVRVRNQPPIDIDAFIVQSVQEHPTIAPTLLEGAKQFAQGFTDEKLWLTSKLSKNQHYDPNPKVVDIPKI